MLAAIGVTVDGDTTGDRAGDPGWAGEGAEANGRSGTCIGAVGKLGGGLIGGNDTIDAAGGDCLLGSEHPTRHASNASNKLRGASNPRRPADVVLSCTMIEGVDRTGFVSLD